MISGISAAAVMFFVGVLFASTAGLTLEFALSLIPGLVLVPFMLTLIICLIKKVRVYVFFIIPCFFFLGILFCSLKTDTSLRPAYLYRGKEVELVGAVASNVTSSNGISQFILETSAIKTDSSTINLKEKIKISTKDKQVVEKSSISVKGTLKIIKEPDNSSSFNAKKYYQRQGIHFSMYSDDIHISPKRMPLSIKAKISLFVNSKIESYISFFPHKTASFLKAVILNNKSDIPPLDKDRMIYAGTYRYLYCPFIHISILLFLLAGKIQHRNRYFLFGTCIFFLYLFMNTLMPSAWRICLFFISAYFITRTLKIYSPSIVMYTTVLIIGIFNPLTLTEPAFILSLASVILIRIFYRDIYQIINKYVKNRYLSPFLAIYLIITVGIYPLCCFFSMNITPWSFILGVVLTPLVTILYPLFYGGFFVFMLTGTFWGAGLEFFTSVLQKLCTGAALLPFANINTQASSIEFPIAFYMVLFCLNRKLRGRRNIKAEILSGLVCFVLSVNFITGLFDAKVTFLSIGNSDACIIQTPGNHTVMIDGGGTAPYSDYDIGTKEVVPFLVSQGINKIDSILVSHYDSDHTDGVISVMKAIPVSKLFIPDYLPDNDLRDIIEAEAKVRNTVVIPIKDSGKFELSKNLVCKVHSSGTYNLNNDNSIVATVEYGDVRMLFPGDITVFAEDNLVPIEADILKVPHHGSATSSGEEFINFAKSKYSVISVGEDNPYGHPSKAVVDRLNRSGTKILRTDKNGEINFIINLSGIKKVYSYKEWFVHGS